MGMEDKMARKFLIKGLERLKDDGAFLDEILDNPEVNALSDYEGDMLAEAVQEIVDTTVSALIDRVHEILR